MNQILLPTLPLSELLVRRKYQNVNNLLTSRNTYYDSRSGRFDFQRSILDNATATMAFRVLQFQANWSLIEELCTSYVYNLKPSKFTESERKIRSQILATENDILKKYHLIQSMMEMPVEKNAKRYFAAVKSSTGYQTIGDPERDLALYLAPFCSYQQFSNCLDIIEEKLRISSSVDDPWIGLFNHLRTSSMAHFKELEEFTKGKFVTD